MAKPERNPWHYSPQWNYYPPHVFNIPKIPLQNGHGHHQVNQDLNEKYSSIRCPEPRRPCQVPYSTFNSYYHQEAHPVHPSFVQHNSFYPKQYIHRPIPHDNYNTPYKVSENIQSYPACSKNCLKTKDQNNYYQNSWKNTSQCKKKAPELDVRKFLATWQEKDDDLLDVSSEAEENKTSHCYESTPLDCTKRNNSEKSKRNYDNCGSGHIPNPAGCVVQPYYIKDNDVSLNRGVSSLEEMNNNIPQRNNLNYDNINNHYYHNKSYYTDYWKPANDKMIPCELSVSYTQQNNHCDINVNSFRNNMSYMKPKQNLIDSSNRSQYNLTASLETGDLFCDINSRNDDHHKQQIVHPMYNDVHHRPINYDEHAYYSNDFSENIVYPDVHSTKEPWELFTTNIKCKDNYKGVEKHISSFNKGPVDSLYNQNINNNVDNGGPIMYEGAFNILPSINDSNLSMTNTVQYSASSAPLQANSSSKSITTEVMSNKTITNAPKCPPGCSKIRPFQFNEEISSDDIDISITSSGELIVEEDNSAVGPISVISFSHTKKERSCIPSTKNDISCQENKYAMKYSGSNLSKNSPTTLNENSNLNSHEEITNNTVPKNSGIENSLKSNLSPEVPKESVDETIKTAVVDLSVMKTQNIEDGISFTDKPDMDYLDLSINYFGVSDMEKLKPGAVVSDVKNKLSPQNVLLNDQQNDLVVSENCQNSNKATNSPVQSTMKMINKDSKCFESGNTFITNDNLILLANCSQEYSCQITEEPKKLDGIEGENISLTLSDNEKPMISPLPNDSLNLSKNDEDIKFLPDKSSCGDVMEKNCESSSSFCEQREKTVDNSSLNCLTNIDSDLIIENTENCSQQSIGLSLPIIEDFPEECSQLSPNEVHFSKSLIQYSELSVNEEGSQKYSIQPDIESLVNVDSENHVHVNCTRQGSSDSKVKENVDIGRSGNEDSQNFLFESDEQIPQDFTTSHCSSEFCCKIAKEWKPSTSKFIEEGKDSEKAVKLIRETVIKCSLRWDKIFNVLSDEENHQRDMSLDLGPAKVELRMPPEKCSSGQWKIVEADNKLQTSSIVQVKRLILKRKSQSEERIPKMIIRKTEGHEYKSFLKNEPNESILNCGKFKIFYDIPSKPKSLKNDLTAD